MMLYKYGSFEKEALILSSTLQDGTASTRYIYNGDFNLIYQDFVYKKDNVILWSLQLLWNNVIEHKII